jgi:hypothetical protein
MDCAEGVATMEGEIVPTPNSDTDDLERQMAEALSRGYGPKIARFAMALLGGAIPIVGGAVAGAAGSWSETEQDHFNRVAASWLQLQKDEIKEIGITIAEILSRLDLNDENVRKRIEGSDYLKLLKKAFRDWSAAESEEKRILIRNLLTNAAVNKICTDDVLRLFIQWIDYYSETHFKVIRHVYKNEGCTRAQVWDSIQGQRVREDSAEADLFKLLIHDLSTGHIIRQHRQKDYYGNYVKATPQRGRTPSGTMTSAFEGEKEYELTELGKQFVRYTMEGVMPRISGATTEPSPGATTAQ